MDFEDDREKVTGRPAVIWEPVEPRVLVATIG